MSSVELEKASVDRENARMCVLFVGKSQVCEGVV